MSRKDQLAGRDPFGDGQQDDEQENQPRSSLSMQEADAALFGELARVEARRQVIRQLPITQIIPDPKQPRRALPFPVQHDWDGNPARTPMLFQRWLEIINQERDFAGQPPFDLNGHLWTEAIEDRQRDEDAYAPEEVGPVEQALLQIVALAVSIRQNGLANPITVEHLEGDRYRIETGERRWLAFHLLFSYFNGENGRPQERETWRRIPATVMEEFSVWRQASENTARANLNAIGRARQYALLMMDLLQEQSITFEPYRQKSPGADRAFYAQVIPYRVPRGKAEILSNALGVSHRAAFTRARTLLGLPNEVWVMGDMHDLTEDDLLRIARIESEQEAIEETRRLVANVATRNNTPATKAQKPPTLFTDTALKRGKRLFSKQNELAAREIFAIRSGVGHASTATKAQLRNQIEELRACLNVLESQLDNPGK